MAILSKKNVSGCSSADKGAVRTLIPLPYEGLNKNKVRVTIFLTSQ